MKRLLLSLSAILIFSSSGQSQSRPVKFGDVSRDEVEMKVYAKDTSASAVVLFDYGESTVVYAPTSGFSLNFERIRRIKILSKAGYGAAEVSLPLFSANNGSEEKVIGLKGVTYNLENGKIIETKLKPESIFREQQDKNHQLVKIALPNVKEGSVIEVSYTITSPFLFNLQPWIFQSTIPVQWSEYRVKTPEYFTYKKQIRGYLQLPYEKTSTLKTILFFASSGGTITMTQRSPNVLKSQTVEYRENYDRWVVRDVPAFRIEPRMASYISYLSSVFFELASYELPNQPATSYNVSWEDLSQSFMQNSYFGGAVDGSGFLNEYVEKATAGMTIPEQKVASIYSFVKKNIEWDGRVTPYASENLKRVLENKKGSSADINLILVSMCKKAGLRSYPLLISTRSHGLIRKESPNFSQFNYVIAAIDIDGKYLLLDATDRTLPMKVLPERCLNGEGLLVSEQSKWVAITPTKSLMIVNSNFSLTPEGAIGGNVQLTFDGYFGKTERGKFLKVGKEVYIKDLAEEHLWNISSSDIQNMEDPDKPIQEKHEFGHKDYAQATDDHLYFNPLLVTRVGENPFKTETRVYPLDFASPEEVIFVARITIPEGWLVEELPKSKIFALPDNTMKCTYSVSHSENVILISNRFSINKTMYSQEEYKMVRDFYDLIVAKHAEQVVIKKK